MKRVSPQLSRHSSLVLVAALILVPLPARAVTTTWIGALGAWGVGSNWSAGEPGAGDDAIVPGAGQPVVTQSGEVCRSLVTGTVDTGSILRIESGSLTVGEHLTISMTEPAIMQQTGGTVSTSVFNLGVAGNGGNTMTGGTLNAGTVRIGSSGGAGTFSMAGTTPVCAIAESLHVGDDGSFGCGAGTLTVGSAAGHGTLLEGAFTLANMPSVTMAGLRMTDSGALSIAIGPTGVSKITVTGTATLAGQLLVTDIVAPLGSYEVLRANLVEGAFGMVTLPPNWAVSVEGNAVILTKGDVAVEPATWGRIKARF